MFKNFILMRIALVSCLLCFVVGTVKESLAAPTCSPSCEACLAGCQTAYNGCVKEIREKEKSERTSISFSGCNGELSGCQWNCTM